MGTDMGTVHDSETGEEVHVGNMLMRDQWNTALHPPLAAAYSPSDAWVHKNRMSGMWGQDPDCEVFLRKEGLRTLLFAGVNTDQCVNGTLTDAFSKGYDCVLLNDGCGTTSPESAREGVEFNAANTVGFMTSCEMLAEGVKGRAKTF
jgi:nicotinamidase-related amidase